MSLPLLIVLGLIGIYLLARGSAREAAARADGDASTLAELARAGSDLGRPHRIEFFLYLPSQHVAEGVAEDLRREGFTVEVRRAEGATDWLALGTREMLPELAALQRWRQRLTALAESRGGAYDGWGTEVEDG
jgi:regulator of RNase E activity RraB